MLIKKDIKKDALIVNSDESTDLQRTKEYYKETFKQIKK